MHVCVRCRQGVTCYQAGGLRTPDSITAGQLYASSICCLTISHFPLLFLSRVHACHTQKKTLRRVVAALRAKGVPCRALVRDRARAANLLPQPSAAAAASSTSSSTSSGPAPPEFEIATGDVYQYATLPPALRGCNAVIVASGEFLAGVLRGGRTL